MKFQPLLPVASALAVVAFVLAFSTPGSVDSELADAPVGQLPIGLEATTTPFTAPAPLLGGLQIGPGPNPFLERFLAGAPEAAPVPESEPATSPESTSSPAAAAAVASQPQQPKVDAAREALTRNTLALRHSLVNIICIPKDGLKAISGTGVIIDPRGVVLTVAHVAQMYLLADFPKEGNVRCTVRMGSPATVSYRADLIYVSPDWIRDNPDTLVAKAPRGTGEYDFALLAIRESVSGEPLPAAFPFVPLSTGTPQVRDKVGIGSYGAQYLSAAQVRSELYPIIVFGTVNNRYTFNRNTVDVISVNGSAAAQQGSSGGSIVNTDGELIGLITTSVVTGDFATRDTRAITPRHIREAFKNDTGHDFDTYIQGGFDTLVAGFVKEAQTLRRVLVNAID